jgi:Spectrin repeat.
MKEELVREKYHGADNVVKREAEVIQKWHDLLKLLDKHRANLTTLCTLMGLLREIDTVMNTIKELEANFKSEDVGPHLLGVEDLLQKHALMEGQMTIAMGETVRRVGRQAQLYINAGHKESTALEGNVDKLNTAYKR